jgi:hypothetical protein
MDKEKSYMAVLKNKYKNGIIVVSETLVQDNIKTLKLQYPFVENDLKIVNSGGDEQNC